MYKLADISHIFARRQQTSHRCIYHRAISRGGMSPRRLSENTIRISKMIRPPAGECQSGYEPDGVIGKQLSRGASSRREIDGRPVYQTPSTRSLAIVMIALIERAYEHRHAFCSTLLSSRRYRNIDHPPPFPLLSVAGKRFLIISRGRPIQLRGP